MGPNLVAVNLGSRASSIATLGANFACARLADGQVKCWGENNQGQLGLGDTVARGATAASLGNNLPTVPLGAGRSVYAGAGNVLEAGTAHVCAVLDNRRVKCWGNGLDGRLGQGATTPLGNTLATTGDSLPYVDLGAGLLTMQLSSGSAHTCALLSTKQIKCWGRNNNGCLGLGDTQAHGDVATEMGANLPFVDLGAGQTVVSVGAGVNHTCALLTGGTVKCWGLGQVLGYGTINDRGSAAGQMGASLPTIDLGTGLTAKTLSVGGNHTCAVLSNNQVKCWGYNIVGQLGLGDTNDRGDTANEMGDNLPIIPLGAGRTAKAVVAGSLSTCVLLDTNQIKCWGINDSGQLGLGDAQNRDTPSELGDFLPTPFLGSGRTVSSLVVGAVGSSSCALLDTRQLKCWGANASGQLGVGSTLTLGDGPNEMGDNLPFVDLGSEL
jgi:alpha-tubulin suppressor-like RCC1 family protein